VHRAVFVTSAQAGRSPCATCWRSFLEARAEPRSFVAQARPRLRHRRRRGAAVRRYLQPKEVGSICTHVGAFRATRHLKIQRLGLVPPVLRSVETPWSISSAGTPRRGDHAVVVARHERSGPIRCGEAGNIRLWAIAGAGRRGGAIQRRDQAIGKALQAGIFDTAAASALLSRRGSFPELVHDPGSSVPARRSSCSGRAMSSVARGRRATDGTPRPAPTKALTCAPHGPRR
jgi:hypothetical protein